MRRWITKAKARGREAEWRKSWQGMRPVVISPTPVHRPTPSAMWPGL